MQKSTGMWFSLFALALTATVLPAAAQENYPSSPIRVVLGFPPGATTDVVARQLAQRFSAQMNVSSFVENKAGANGNIGADYVAKSKPDGYTVFVNTPSIILSPAMGDKLPYDVLKDFAAVSLVCTGPLVLVVHPAVAANSAAEFISLLRANPGKYAYGSGGAGNNTHLTPLLFLQSNGLTALHVPYKGAAESLIDLVAGRVQFEMQNSGAVMPLIKDKRIRALAVTSLKRSSLLPEVPTLAEAAMPGFEAVGYFGVLVPAKTPPAIIRRLNSEILKGLQDPEMKARLVQEDAVAVGSTPEEYGAYLRNEMERWTKVIKSSGVKVD